MVPLRAVLIVERQQIAGLIDAGGEARAREKHEREQSVTARSISGRVRHQQCGQEDRFLAKFLAEQAIARGGFVAFVEKEIERREDAVEALTEISAFGNIEPKSRSSLTAALASLAV